jgi:opacity protein-like surface antigen
MKKILLSLVAMMFLASAAQAAVVTGPTIDFPISVTVNEAIQLSATVDVLDFGSVSTGINVFSNLGQGNPRATVQNIGAQEIDLNALVLVSSAGNVMTLGTTLSDTAADQGVLAGIWTYYNNDDGVDPDGLDLTIGKFADDDVLDATASVATVAGAHQDPLDPAIIGGQNIPGYDVPQWESRSMRFLFQTPSSVPTTINEPQTMTVTIGGQL